MKQTVIVPSLKEFFTSDNPFNGTVVVEKFMQLNGSSIITTDISPIISTMIPVIGKAGAAESLAVILNCQ